MKRRSVCALAGAELDWAVAKVLGVKTGYSSVQGPKRLRASTHYPESSVFAGEVFAPSTSREQGYLIVERHHITVGPWDTSPAMAHMPGPISYTNPRMVGPTPLVAAMRCFVASKLGDEIDIPEFLI